MNVIVTVKQVPDPEAPAGAFRVGSDDRVVVSPTVSRVVSPYDESALEAALQLKDSHDARVILACLGAEADDNFLHEAMATGADEAYLIADELFNNADAFVTAYALARAIAKIGPGLGNDDLILCGRQASDTDAGVVGSLIAEFLGLPSATVVRKVELSDGAARVERVIEDGIELLEVSRPALLTMTSELYTLRYANVMDIMMAAEKEVTVWGAADIDADLGEIAAIANRSVVLKDLIPASQTHCEIIGGDSLEDAASNLAQALRGRKVF